jgi:hypothetical protein
VKLVDKQATTTSGLPDVKPARRVIAEIVLSASDAPHAMKMLDVATLCFRFAPERRHSLQRSVCFKGADTVAKVENRTTPKISRKLIFRPLRRCNAL